MILLCGVRCVSSAQIVDAYPWTFWLYIRVYVRQAWISHIHADHHVGLVSVLAARRALLGASAPPLAVAGPWPLRKWLQAFEQNVQKLNFTFLLLPETTRENMLRADEADGGGAPFGARALVRCSSAVAVAHADTASALETNLCRLVPMPRIQPARNTTAFRKCDSVQRNAQSRISDFSLVLSARRVRRVRSLLSRRSSASPGCGPRLLCTAPTRTL